MQLRHRRGCPEADQLPRYQPKPEIQKKKQTVPMKRPQQKCGIARKTRSSQSVVSKPVSQTKLVIKLRIRPRQNQVDAVPVAEPEFLEEREEKMPAPEYSSSLTPMSQLSYQSSSAGIIAQEDDQYAAYDICRPIVVPIIGPAPVQRRHGSKRRVRGRVQEASEGHEDARRQAEAVGDECMADSESSSLDDEERLASSPPPTDRWLATVMNQSVSSHTSSGAGIVVPVPDVAEAWLQEHIEQAAEALEEEISPMMLSPSPDETPSLPGPSRPAQTYVYPYRGAESFTRYQDRDVQMDTDSD